MIRSNGEYRVDLRERMRDGDGCVRIEHLWEAGEELKGKVRMFARLTLEPGCSIGFHRHEAEEEVFVVTRGEGELDDDGRISEIRSGDTILTGGGAGHSVRCTGKEPLELLAVILPH